MVRYRMIAQIHDFIWSSGMLVCFLFVGILYTIRLRGFPILGIRHWLGHTIGSTFTGRKESASKDTVTSLQSACTALAATIGTGNITGVATAILAGGAGAVFWMWVSAFLGMATAYGETELGIRYRKRDQNGGWVSGAMMYLEHGLGCRWLAGLYAIFCILASFGMGSMVQANAISEAAGLTISISPLLVGVCLTLLSGCIIAGGAGFIIKTAEKLVPISAFLYMTASIGVIFLFRENFINALHIILQDAFSFRSASGGMVGFFVSKSVRYGVARGVFSNEAGLGSLAALNGGADVKTAGSQGQWAIFEVFFDTIVSCTLTALVILCVDGEKLTLFQGNGAELIGHCFSRGLGAMGGCVISLCTALFAFATIIAWYYMGKQAVIYFGEIVGANFSSLYMVGYIASVFLGSICSMETVWEVSDIFNGMMALPNLTALILLVREVRKPEM